MEKKMTINKVLAGAVLVVWMAISYGVSFLKIESAEQFGSALIPLAIYGLGFWLIYKGLKEKK